MSGSDYTLTAHGLYKPNVNADTGTWGTHLNANADLLDPLLAGTGWAVTSVAGKTGDVLLIHTDITDWNAATSSFLTSAVASFNARIGAVSLLSADVTGALGYTPYDAANPAGYTTASQLANYVPLSQRAALNGVATLDATGVVPTLQLPGAVTGTLSYKGGWNASTNIPVMASGALAGGVLQTAGSYYLVTAGATTAAIDGITTWVAGDWISSNGTIWQRVQNSTSPYLPLAGGNMSAGSSITLSGDTWQAAIEPDVVWSLRDTSGNIAVTLSPAGAFSVASINTTSVVGLTTLTGLTTLGATNATFTTATIANEAIADLVMPDLIGAVAGSNGNVVSGYDALTGTFNVAALNANVLTVNGAPISTAGATVLGDAVDVRDPAYGALGTAAFNHGRVTTSGSALTLINYHGTFSVTVIDANTAQITITNYVRWSGWGFQPWHTGKLFYCKTDDNAFTFLGVVKQHADGANIIVSTTSPFTAQTSVTGTITCPCFDTGMVLTPIKYICVDGMGKEGWWTYDLVTGAAVARQIDTITPYGTQTFVSRITTVNTPQQVTIANVTGATPPNATFPMAWTDAPTLVQWGPNDIDAVATAARAAWDKGLRRIKFTGQAHYLMLGVCASGQWLARYLTATAVDTGPLLNGVMWQSDGASTWACTDGGAMYPHRAAIPGARAIREATKRISGRSHLRRCAQLSTINVLITGDSLGSLNPQSQVTMVMGVMRFMDEFTRQNPGKTINYYCNGIGGSTWNSLMNPVMFMTNTTPAITYGTVPKPLATPTLYRAFFSNINQTGTGPAIVPDLAVVYLNTANDTQSVDALSMHGIINIIRAVTHADGFGPTDVILQTDLACNNQVVNSGTGNMTVLPDPHAKPWFHDYALNLNRTTASARGYGCVDMAEQVARAAWGQDMVRRQLRQIPSATWNLTPTAPVSLGPRCRDFALWFSLPGAANDLAAWTALQEISFQCSFNPGNRIIWRLGPNNHIWMCVTTVGHFVDTVVSMTTGSPTLTLAAPTSTTIDANMPGKSLQLSVRSSAGITFDSTWENRCFIVQSGSNDGAGASPPGRRFQRNYIRRTMDANNVLTFERPFDGGDVTLAAASFTYGGQQFLAADNVTMTDIAMILPDGTLFSSNVAYGGTTPTLTVATMQDNAPQTLAAQTVSMFLGKMSVRWFDTGIVPSTTTAVGTYELNVSRDRLAAGYLPDLNPTPIIPASVFRTIERFGAECNVIVRAKGAQQVAATNVWVDADQPCASTCPAWEMRGIFDSNSVDQFGGTSGHFGSRMRSEVMDPLFATQDLSTG